MDSIINDFTINIATANGTGSQSANLILLQSLFDMGVPVSGKNLFPSNISPKEMLARLQARRKEYVPGTPSVAIGDPATIVHFVHYPIVADGVPVT